VPRITRWLGALALAATLAGCAAPGLIYTEIIEPLDLDASVTSAVPEDGQSSWKTFAYAIRVDWSSAAIADAARAGGLTEIYYADMEHIYVLFGIWEQRRAIVYGR
jgi:hypothetical protein